MNKIRVRFNRQHGGSEAKWKIFAEGQMFLAYSINFNVPCFTETTVENDIPHWNIACYGKLVWNGPEAHIIPQQ